MGELNFGGGNKNLVGASLLGGFFQVRGVGGGGMSTFWAGGGNSPHPPPLPSRENPAYV